TSKPKLPKPAKPLARLRLTLAVKREGKWLMDKAKDAAASAQDSMQHAGQQMKQKAQGAADVVKDKTGLNKNT
ncbi:hypothetical protein HID58_095856, partial [Brassica napus]